MIDDESPDEFEQEIGLLIADAVVQALDCGDPQRFLDWMRSDALRRYPQLFPSQAGAANAQFATQLGYTIWNALPQPDNGLRPRPLPQPGRNEPCVCGSGRKFKQCCARLPAAEPLQTEMLLPLVLDTLRPAQLDQVLSQRRLSPELIAELADKLLQQDDRPKRVMVLLEPLFQGKIDKLDSRHGFAMNVLCDAYDRLGHDDKKRKFLDGLTHKAGRELRADAWQRLATMHQDQGDFDSAWQAFSQAQRANPKDPALSVLEVTLLLGDRRTDEAVDRARFWCAQLLRYDEVNEELVDWLRRVMDDPMGVISDLFTGYDAPGVDRLRVFLDAAIERPLPRYRADVAPAAEAASSANSQIPLFDAPSDQEEMIDREKGRRFAELLAPAGLREIERQWQGVYSAEDAWNEQAASVWQGFLEQHPAAGDSLPILEDLVMAIFASGAAAQPWVQESLLKGLLARAAEIFKLAWQGVPREAMLPWGLLENRPLLSLLERYADLLMVLGDSSLAGSVYQRLIHLNPNDNQGIRSRLTNLLLSNGEDEAALGLAAQFPGDLFPEVTYGQVLARYRLGDLDAAREALKIAEKYQTHIPFCLLTANLAQPDPDLPYGVIFGGEEQAWLYREEMLGVWRASDGALDWLRRESGG